ncbi:MAG: hypothetical protein JW904_12115 [Spirochaetales bacterium]|nr:hypothetical protein [Spirochaetales bacterium]
MDVLTQKGTQFIGRLLENPAIATLSPLQKELQILEFLGAHRNELYPTLSSNQFFPGKPEGEIFAILLSSLYLVINQSLDPALKHIVSAQIDFSFIKHFSTSQPAPESVRQSVLMFLKKLLTRPLARRTATGPLTALELGLVDRYLDHGLSRREYMCMELEKVQRLRMESVEIKNYIKTTLLLKPAIALPLAEADMNNQELRGATVQPVFAERVHTLIKNDLKLLPDEVQKSALNANLSYEENRELEATSRIAAILSARAAYAKQFTKIDRGADTPDKSWFSIARRNAKFYGFDLKMCEEFYKIASDFGY